MNSKFAIPGLACILLLQACIVGGGGTGGEGLTGTLVDAKGAPVAGAKVGVYSQAGGAVAVDSMLTDAEGKFRFSALAAGRYNVAASVRRHDTTLAAFVRGVDIAEKLDLGDRALSPSGNLEVAVRSGEGEPLSGAQCAVAASPYVDVSDSGGTCNLEGLAPGFYQVGIIGDGDTTLTDTLEVQSSVTAGIITVIVTSGPGLGGRWSPRASGVRADLHAVIWTGSQYVAVGDSGRVLLSANGVNWNTSSVQSPKSRLRGIAWTGQQLVAIGRNKQDSGEIFTSPTGEVWTRRAAFSQGLNAVIWVEALGELVAFGDSGTIRTSADGVQWDSAFSGTGIHLNSATWTDSLIVAVGPGTSGVGMILGVILTSPDGVNWTVQLGNAPWGSPSFVGNLVHVAWTGEEAVAVARYGGAFSSPNGLEWAQYNGVGSTAKATLKSGGRLVVIGYFSADNTAGIWTSENGVYVARYAGAPSKSLNAIAAKPNVQLVVVGDEGTILTSP
jgi:hypothetical protein